MGLWGFFFVSIYVSWFSFVMSIYYFSNKQTFLIKSDDRKVERKNSEYERVNRVGIELKFNMRLSVTPSALL